MIAKKLAAICPCVLIAGAVTAAWMPKSWEQSMAPPAAAAPASHFEEHPGAIARQDWRTVPAHAVTASVSIHPRRGRKTAEPSNAAVRAAENEVTLQAALNTIGN